MNHSITRTDDSIIIEKFCLELASYFGRTDNRGMVNHVPQNLKTDFMFEFRFFFL